MKDFKIHFLNTIWSDCMLLEYDQHYGFVDTASPFYFDMIDKYLKELKIKKLDFIILTHFHHDHYGNIKRIMENYEVDKLYMKHYYNVEGSNSAGTDSDDEYLMNEQRNYLEIVKYAYNKIIYLDQLKQKYYQVPFYDVLIELYDLESHLYNVYNDINSPYYHKFMFNENYNSMAIYVNYLNYHIYLGGDIPDTNNEIKEFNHLGLKAVKNIKKNHQITSFDVVKAPHHGTPYFTTKEVIEELQPKHLIITNTNRWLDNYHTIDMVKEIVKDCKIYQTDHQKYIFIFNEELRIEKILDESPFFIYGD